jgi:hypothetical protein
MNVQVIASIILGSLSAIETLLPLLGVGGVNVAAVTSVIGVLQKIVPVLEQIAPFAIDEVGLIYQGIKNIIANLRGGETSAQQDADLDALDAKVDAAWNAILPQFDPDAPPPVVST